MLGLMICPGLCGRLLPIDCPRARVAVTGGLGVHERGCVGLVGLIVVIVGRKRI